MFINTIVIYNQRPTDIVHYYPEMYIKSHYNNRGPSFFTQSTLTANTVFIKSSNTPLNLILLIVFFIDWTTLLTFWQLKH